MLKISLNMTSKSIDKKDKHMPRRNWSRYHNLQNDSVEKIPLKNTKKRETQEKLSNLKSFPTKKKRNYYNPKEEARYIDHSIYTIFKNTKCCYSLNCV